MYDARAQNYDSKIHEEYLIHDIPFPFPHSHVHSYKHNCGN